MLLIMTYLFPVSSLKNTIFENEGCIQSFKENDILISNDEKKADIFITRDLYLQSYKIISFLTKTSQYKGQSVLVWTHEPRFCKTSEEIISIPGHPLIHIMNMYTKNVYFSNFSFYGKNVDRLLEGISDIEFSRRPIVGLASYVSEKNQKTVIGGVDIDLTVKRQKLLLDGYRMGVVDIYGKNWPDHISTSESRGPGWHDKKLAILKDYQFNISLENTSFDYYCTEKIWDSIKSYCLPIYSSFNNKIYETFPKNSFLDFDEFDSNLELYRYIGKMSKKEYLERLNKCIHVFNDSYKKLDMKIESKKAINELVNKIRQIAVN